MTTIELNGNVMSSPKAQNADSDLLKFPRCLPGATRVLLFTDHGLNLVQTQGAVNCGRHDNQKLESAAEEWGQVIGSSGVRKW